MSSLRFDDKNKKTNLSIRKMSSMIQTMAASGVVTVYAKGSLKKSFPFYTPLHHLIFQ
jgi:hypothetical protein